MERTNPPKHTASFFGLFYHKMKLNQSLITFNLNNGGKSKVGDQNFDYISFLSEIA